MSKAKPGILVFYDGELARVLAVGEGVHITLEYLERPACPSCGPKRVSMMEDSPLWRSHVEPVAPVTMIVEALERLMAEGRSVLPDASDDQASNLEQWAAGLLGVLTGPGTAARRPSVVPAGMSLSEWVFGEGGS